MRRRADASPTVFTRGLSAIRHPSGVRVISRETTRELGPSDDEAALFCLLADEIAAERIQDVQRVVLDWRDDGCHLLVHSSSFVLLQPVVAGP
jgi:hypothetical protein